MDDADRIIGLHDRHAQIWDKERWRNLFERLWLDRFLAKPSHCAVNAFRSFSRPEIATELVLLGNRDRPGNCSRFLQHQAGNIRQLTSVQRDRRHWTGIIREGDRQGAHPILAAGMDGHRTRCQCHESTRLHQLEAELHRCR